MKKNLIKAFLSLGVLALLAASGMTIAQETYEVTIGNMNSYGILNLGRLIMRNSGGNPGIILDGAYSQSDYVIKIGPDLAAENNLSKLRVTNICDNKGNNCKKIADLSTGIKINGTNGLVCIKTNDKEINCNQTLGAGVITIKQGGISKGNFNVNTTSAQTIELSGAIALEGTNSRFCTKKNDDTIECNVTTGTILNVSVPNPVPTLSRESTTTIGSVGGTEFKVTTPANPHKAGRNVVANTENGTSAGTTNNTNTFLNYAEGSDANSKSHIQIQGAGGTTVTAENNVITITSSTNGGGGDHITGKNIVGQYSTSTANNSSVTNNPYINHVENSQVTSSIQIRGSGATTVEKSNNVITISSTAGDGNGNVSVTNNNPTLSRGTRSTVGAVNGTSLTVTLPANPNSTNTFKVKADGTDVATFNQSSDSYINLVAGSNISLARDTTNKKITISSTAAGGDSVWEIGNITRNSQTLSNAIKPASTYISKDLYLPEGDIYHDGNVLIKTLGSNSVYRTNDIRITDYGVSIGEMANRTAGLGVHGPITVGKYTLSEGEINALRPGQCANTNRNTISIFASGAGADEHFEILGSRQILLGKKDGGYLYVSNNDKLGINTTNLNNSSTLVVNGPLKIGNDCNYKSCSADNKGEIRYYEQNNVGHFVGCTQTSNGYKRRDLTIGSTDLTVPNKNCNSDSFNIPYDSSTYVSTPQVQCR